MRYQILYVNKEEAEDIAKEISELKFVKEVLLSEFDNIDENFVGNLARFWYNIILYEEVRKEYWQFSDNSVLF